MDQTGSTRSYPTATTARCKKVSLECPPLPAQQAGWLPHHTRSLPPGFLALTSLCATGYVCPNLCQLLATLTPPPPPQPPLSRGLAQLLANAVWAPWGRRGGARRLTPPLADALLGRTGRVA
eukprot:361767-Chlamydomonas_euryale.AAC.18